MPSNAAAQPSGRSQSKGVSVERETGRVAMPRALSRALTRAPVFPPSADDENRTLRHDLYLYDFPSPWRDRPPWLIVLGVRQISGLAATDCLLFGSEEALDDLRQHRIDGERVVSGVRQDRELVCGPQ